MKQRLSLRLSLVLALLLGMVLAGGSSTQAAEDAGNSLIKDAKALFEKYKALDHDSDPALVDLYSDDAVIYAALDRTGGGQTQEKFSKSEYAQEIKRSLKDPHVRELNSKTTMEAPVIKTERHQVMEDKGLKDEVVVSVSFLAKHDHSALKVHWLLKKDSQGQLKIFEEHSLAYSMRKHRLKQKSQQDSNRQDSLKQNEPQAQP
ncbi:MAG: hypothetical protein K2Y32_24130 [Candidatus Obscuribacterales bacterium]|nr:hypothetical protein [Candidatus Obscuribacterales bacterium]